MSRHSNNSNLIDTTTPATATSTAISLSESDFADESLTLRAVAADACKRVHIGTAVMPHLLCNDSGNEPEYAATVESEFNAIVVEHHLKWAPLCTEEPGPLPDGVPSTRLGRYDFYESDRIVDWAVARGIHVKGHVLVWHVTSPTAILQQLADDPPQLRAAIKAHIYTVMGHYRGRITEWDVVNESLAPDGSLAENVFLQALGPSYIADCFTWAHEADPDAKLFYNDNKVEGLGTAKSDAFYNLVADLQAKGVPIHGVGLQAHFKAGGIGPNKAVPTPRAVKQQIQRLGALGLTVHLSEVDVRVGTLDDPATRVTAQTQIYHDILAAALSEPACTAIYIWGFTDKHTWIHDFYTEAEDESPLLWDTHYRRKPAYFAVRQALQSLTPRGRVGGEGVLLDADADVDGLPWGHAWRPTDGDDGPAEIKAGDDRPDWLQTTNDDTNKPDWLQDKTPPARNTSSGNNKSDPFLDGGDELQSVDDDDVQSGDGGLTSGDEFVSGDEGGMTSGDDMQSDDGMAEPMQNLRDDIPEIS